MEEAFDRILDLYCAEDDVESLEDLADMMEELAHDDPAIAMRMSEMFEKGDVFPKDEVLARMYREMADRL